MNLQESLTPHIDSGLIEGAWLQRDGQVYEVIGNLSPEASGILASAFDHLLAYSKQHKRGAKSVLLMFETRQLYLVFVGTTAIGCLLSRQEKLEKEQEIIFQSLALRLGMKSLSASAAQPLDISRASERETIQIGQPDLWSEFRTFIETKLAQFLSESQIPVFIETRIGAAVPATKQEFYEAASNIASGLPDKAKSRSMKSLFEEELTRLFD